MATKPNKHNRRPNRRAKRILERARLRARVVTAEAEAEANRLRMSAFTESQAQTERLRADADTQALRAIEQAHTEAGWILTQARSYAEAESRARTAEAELAAERLRSSAVVATEQLRREALAEREQGLRDAAVEHLRMRDEALIDAARIRDDARTEAVAYLARLDAAREVILAEARAEAEAIATRASEARAEEEIRAFLDAQNLAAPQTPDAGPELDLGAVPADHPVPGPSFEPFDPAVPDLPLVAVHPYEPEDRFDPGEVAAAETNALFEAPSVPSVAPGPFIWDTEAPSAPTAALAWTAEVVPVEESEFWAEPVTEDHRSRRWRRSGNRRS